MRIGIDATSWTSRRGFGRFTRELLRALAGLGTADEFVLLSDRQTAKEASFPQGWKLLVAETSESPAKAAASDGRRSVGDVWAMRRLAASEKLDLIYFPAVYSYFPVGGRVPCLVTFHDVIAETLPHLVFENRRSRYLWNLKSRLALRRSAGVVTVSEASKTGLMKKYGLRPERIRLISEAPSDVFRPVDPGEQGHNEALSRYGLSARDRFFLYVGGISPHKNIENLIRAFAMAAGLAPSDYRLVLVGDHEGDVFRTCHASLVQLAEELGVAERVMFTGFVPDEYLAHLYSVARAFVFPSFLEGFGLPAVEAMACGAPVVTSNRGSLPEVVGDAGPLFDPHDHVALARILERLAEDDQYRQELRQRSLDRARGFRWELSAARALEIFREFAP